MEWGSLTTMGWDSLTTIEWDSLTTIEWDSLTKMGWDTLTTMDWERSVQFGVWTQGGYTIKFNFISFTLFCEPTIFVKDYIGVRIR